MLSAIRSPEKWPETGIIGGINSVEKKDVANCLSIQESEEFLPIGQLVAGLFTSRIDVSDDDMKELCNQLIPRKSGQAVFLCPSTDRTEVAAKAIDLKTGKVTSTDVQIIEDKEFLDETMVIKAVGSINLDCKMAASALEEFLTDLSTRLKSLTFNLVGSDFLIQSG